MSHPKPLLAPSRCPAFNDAARGHIYAVFEVVADEAYTGREWDGKKVVGVLKDFEKRRTYREVPDRRLADPRVLSLQELLKAMRPDGPSL